MKHILNFKKFCLTENIDTTDYSGSYDSLRDFIYNKKLQQIFKDKYDIPDDKDWEYYTSGELGYDEEIIEELVGKDYRIRYDEEDDMFFITKKKTGKINYKIELSDDNTILDVMDVHSEFEPRFAVIVDGNIVGGTTYEIDENNDYNFDMSINDEYQGYGISKKLVDYVIKDAKKLKCSGIKGMVVNNMLFDYLTQNGFHGSIDSDTKYIYKKL
jgi:GNAT superfamily N-acetyltransferase